MKKAISKKISGLLLAFVLTAVCINGAFAYTDTADAAYAKEIDYASSFGVLNGYEDGTFQPERKVTRAEFAAIAIRLRNQASAAAGTVYGGEFSDVTAQHWASGVIELAYATGLINGYDTGEFMPDKTVSYQEAATVIVNLLGYKNQAERRGGYPAGYISLATQFGLFHFSGIQLTAAMNRAEVAYMAAKALDTKIMITTALTGDGFELEEGGTLAEVFFEAERRRGVVTGTPVDSFNGNAVKDGMVEIDNVRYQTELDCSAFLGERVEYTVTGDEGDEQVVYMAPVSRRESLTIDAKDFIDVENLFTSNARLRYWDEKQRVCTADFSGAARIIYNRKLLSYEEAGLINLKADSGSYECIDQDGDGIYELLKITSYDSHYVKRVYSGTDDTITLAFDNSETFVYDKDDAKQHVSVYFENAGTDISEIRETDVVSAAVSADGKAAELVICRDKAEGTVEETERQNDEAYIVIGGVRYLLAGKLKNLQSGTNAGDSGIYYLSFLGEAVYFEEGESGSAAAQYAYLTAFNVPSGGIKTDVEVKLLETDNTFAVYPLAERVRFQQYGTEKTVKAQEVYNALYHEPQFYDLRNVYTQVVKYKTNANGEISYLAVAKDDADTESFSVAAPERKRFYSNSLFDQQWKITPKTVLFKIPCTAQGEEMTRYQSGAASKFFKNGTTYQVILYDVDENGEVGAVMYRVPRQTRYLTYPIDLASSKVLTIDKVSTKLDSEGDAKTVVSGVCNNVYTSYFVNEELMATKAERDKLAFGNVIQFQTNAVKVDAAYYDGEAEEIMTVSLLCNPKKTAQRMLWNQTEIQQNSPKITEVFGTVTAINETQVTVSVPDGKDKKEAEIFLGDTQKVIRVEQGSEKVNMGTFYDIKPGQKIFVRLRYNRVRDVVLYE